LVADPRVREYAKLLVERCLDVQPGWQVLIRTTVLARPVYEEIARLIGRRGAYVLPRIGFELWPTDVAWASEAPEALLGELPEIERYDSDHMDARMTIDAPENTRELSELSVERRTLRTKATRYFLRRTMADEIPWVSCQFPTNALAQDAGMTLVEFEDLLYGACLLDWDAEGERMRRAAERFDEAREIRILGADTDLTMSLEGRWSEVDDGRANMPGGEFFTSPVEDSAEGTIVFGEFPALRLGEEVRGARLVFRAGEVVDASASAGERALVAALDTDAGSRRIGELGIGCNPRIQRYMENVLFDEKIAGTVHLALGQSYPKVGGQNASSLHWDIVKDLRNGGQILLDGELVQENGAWAGPLAGL
jgi:aminopeptidase